MKKKSKKSIGKSLTIVKYFGIAAVVFGLLIVFKLYGVITAPDNQCTRPHTSTSKAPEKLETATDYYNLGNYHYDIGDCKQAVDDYTKSITIDPNFAKAYNNRAYTNMRMHNYKEALPDLDKAIKLNPNYVQARMNRGDIHNYYYQIDRNMAIEDYNKVISLGATHDTSVCGHKAMAETNNIIPLAFLRSASRADCK